MSAIEQVLSQCRSGGGFAKRRRFTLAREKAIDKLRSFALADPHFYVLQFIQAAVACGARVVDFEIEEEEVVFSFVGGRIRGEELAHLFDFLFAGKDRLEVAHLRALALGVNALLSFEPDEIVIVSGDGRPETTARAVLTRGGTVLEMGRSDRPLAGTFLQATGLKRERVRRRGFRDTDEQNAIETRCLAAPVPILINMAAPFGGVQNRTPNPFGYSPLVRFDEGDLYGTLGLCTLPVPASFRVLTFGVWIQTLAIPLVPGQKIGGIVSFDRLRKTADHSAIVQDDVFEELKLRLRPYAQRLLAGRPAASVRGISHLGGEPIPPRTLRTFLRRHRRVVVVPDGLAPDSPLGTMARSIGEALGSPVLSCPAPAQNSLRLLGGRDLSVLCPDLGERAELEFYHQRPAEPPPEPYWAGPENLTGLRFEPAAPDAKTRPALPAPLERECRARFGGAEIRGVLFAPMGRPPSSRGTFVQAITVDRVAWQGELDDGAVGLWLQMRVPDTSPAWLRKAPGSAGSCRASLLASALLRRNRRVQQALLERMLRALCAQRRNLSAEERRRVLHALAGRALAGLRRKRDGSPAATLTLLGPPGELLDVPVLATMAGRELSAKGLLRLMDENEGMIFGTVPEAPADLSGLDPDRILRLDLESERLLVGIFGEAAYVRVDRRDTLAAASGVACRDWVFGLRRFPSFPLPVEGADPTSWPRPARERLLDELTAQLVECFRGRASPAVGPPGEAPEENRRQACRHLQWLAAQNLDDPALLERLQLWRLPLFLDPHGGAHTPEALASARRGPDGVVLRLDAGLGFGPLTEAARCGRAASATPQALSVGPQLCRRLVRFAGIALESDPLGSGAEFPPAQATAALALERIRVRSGVCEGELAIPVRPVRSPAVAVQDRRNRVLWRIATSGSDLELAGTLRLLSGGLTEKRRAGIRQILARCQQRLMERLLIRCERRQEPRRARVEELLLGYASGQLTLTETPHGVLAGVKTPAARAILDQPLFPVSSRERVSAWRLLCEHFAFGESGAGSAAPGTARVRRAKTDLPEHLARWLRNTLDPARVLRPGRPIPIPARNIQPPAGETSLARAIEAWLEALRTDDVAGGRDTPSPVRIAIEEDPVPLGNDPASLGECLLHFGTGGRMVGSTLRLNPGHWLVDACRKNPLDAEARAWLLLACYARINAELAEVTNRHELLFQRRVLEALDKGALEGVPVSDHP
jgi:hypothetical protein